MKEKSCCFTGYRPSKFPFKLNSASSEYNLLENSLYNKISELIKEGYDTFYSGMAMGFDIIAAEAVLTLKEVYKENYDIKLICVLPFIDQVETFERGWKKRHTEIIKNADDVILSSDVYRQDCYSKRNRFMVDRADVVLTWYDGRPGGTANTLSYAAKRNKAIINLNGERVFDYLNFETFAVLPEESE